MTPIAAQLRFALERHVPLDAEEAASLARLIAFVAEGDPFRRGHPLGHVTASAVVARPDGSEVLLVHHRRLGRWLQPGGHTDPEDASPFHTARREATEETGVAELRAPYGDRILDVDVHPIPERPGEPAHLHFDLRYLLTTEQRRLAPQAREVRGVAWFPVGEVLGGLYEGSLVRAVRKGVELLAARSQAERL